MGLVLKGSYTLRVLYSISVLSLVRGWGGVGWGAGKERGRARFSTAARALRGLWQSLDRPGDDLGIVKPGPPGRGPARPPG